MPVLVGKLSDIATPLVPCEHSHLISTASCRSISHGLTDAPSSSPSSSCRSFQPGEAVVLFTFEADADPKASTTEPAVDGEPKPTTIMHAKCAYLNMAFLAATQALEGYVPEWLALHRDDQKLSTPTTYFEQHLPRLSTLENIVIGKMRPDPYGSARVDSGCTCADDLHFVPDAASEEEAKWLETNKAGRWRPEEIQDFFSSHGHRPWDDSTGSESAALSKGWIHMNHTIQSLSQALITVAPGDQASIAPPSELIQSRTELARKVSRSKRTPSEKSSHWAQRTVWGIYGVHFVS